MTIPYKAIPGKPGAVIKFSATRALSARQGYRDLFFSAFSLVNTTLAVDVMGYQSMPSVLVMAHEASATSVDSWLKYLAKHYLNLEGNSKGTEIIADRSVHGVYGMSKSPKVMLPGGSEPEETENQKSLVTVSASLPLAENEFLSNIVIDRRTGIHVSYFKKSDGTPDQMRQVQAAQKHFDIVLVNHDVLESLEDEENVTVLEYVSSGANISSSNRIPVQVFNEVSSLAKDKKRKKHVDGIYSIDNDYRNVELSMFIANAMMIAALAPEVENPWDSVAFSDVSFKEKMSLLSINASESDMSMSALITGATVGLAGSLVAMVTGSLVDSDWAIAQALSMPFGGMALFGGSCATMSKLSGKAEKHVKGYNKKFIEQAPSTVQSLSQDLIPLSENPVLLTAGVNFQDEHTIAPMRELSALNSSDSRPEEHKAIEAPPASTTVISGEGSSNSTIRYQQTVTPRIPLSKNTIMKRLAKLSDQWMSYELDPMKSLDYPLMLDPACDQTRRFLMAMSDVKSLEEELAAGEASLADFRDAVLYAEEMFMAAEGNAKKMRYVHLDAVQKKKIRNARPLVALLDDEKASPHEKVSAYRKAGDFLEGIIALPDRPIMGLLEAVK